MSCIFGNDVFIFLYVLFIHWEYSFVDFYFYSNLSFTFDFYFPVVFTNFFTEDKLHTCIINYVNCANLHWPPFLESTIIIGYYTIIDTITVIIDNNFFISLVVRITINRMMTHSLTSTLNTLETCCLKERNPSMWFTWRMQTGHRWTNTASIENSGCLSKPPL